MLVYWDSTIYTMTCSGDAGMATKGQKKRLDGWWTETVMTIDEQGLLTPHMYVHVWKGCSAVVGAHTLYTCQRMDNHKD